jgi:hypothetical protein
MKTLPNGFLRHRIIVLAAAGIAAAGALIALMGVVTAALAGLPG